MTRRDAFVLLLGALLGFAARAVGRSLALDVSRACDPVDPSGLDYLRPNAQRQIDDLRGSHFFKVHEVPVTHIPRWGS